MSVYDVIPEHPGFTQEELEAIGTEAILRGEVEGTHRCPSHVGPDGWVPCIGADLTGDDARHATYRWRSEIHTAEGDGGASVYYSMRYYYRAVVVLCGVCGRAVSAGPVTVTIA